MQSTEEYLDQLLASVSDEEPSSDTDVNNKHHMKSIEELDESELTEEALQKQLALLLGLEVEEEGFDLDESEDFMAQYAEEVSADEPNLNSQPIINNDVMDIPDEPVAEVKEEPLEELIESQVAATSETPEISDTGVLSADEIAALFASMENEDTAEEVTESFAEVQAEPQEEIVESQAEPVVETSEVSNTGVLSADEIAALFASMGNDEPMAEETVSEEVPVEEISEDVVSSEDGGALTREELEELGLGDIADVLTESVQENSAPEESTQQIVEIPDFDSDEEMFLEIENVDEMLEATARLAEQESASSDAGAQVEEDIMSMLTQFEEESVLESLAAQEESAKAAEVAVNMALEEEDNGIPEELLEEAETDKKSKKKAKKEKVKKEKVKKEKPVKEKKNKVSLKDKLTAFMFEEGDEGEVNPEVADEMSEEEKPAKVKKEKASKKDKKAKKDSKKAGNADENAAIEAELAEEDKKAKKKKEKVPKEKKKKKVVISEKTPAQEAAERREARHSIGAKGIVATLLVCASLLGLILVGTYFVPRYLSLQAARVAFYAQDYEETAMRLEGRKLNDSDRIMYEKASLLFGLEERYHQYEVYEKRGLAKEALDELLQGVIACNEELILVEQLGIEAEWKLIKDQFIQALAERYGMDPVTVEAVCALRNPYYTVAVENIMAGRPYDDMSAYGGEESVAEEPSEDGVETPAVGEDTGLNPEDMEDLLPEEEAIIEQIQQENEQDAVTDEEIQENDNELYSGSVEGGEVNFVE